MYLSISSSIGGIEIVGLFLIWCIYVVRFISPVLIVRDIVSFWYKISPMIIIIVSLIRLSLGVYYWTVHIKVTPLVVSNDRIHKEYKVVFISDLHVEAIHSRWYVQSIVNRIQALQPDIVLIGGDLMNIGKTKYMDAFLPFNQIKIPVYATLGNHDYMWNSGAIPVSYTHLTLPTIYSV